MNTLKKLLPLTTLLFLLVNLLFAQTQTYYLPLLPFQTLSSCSNPPQLLFDEDFTDGLFDDFGSSGNDKWRIFPSAGQGVAFRSPNNRPFPLAFSRIPKLGNTGWAGAQWARWTDLDNDNNYDDNELTYFELHKNIDVCVLDFTSFSDLARKPETYGVEVAMLEWRNALPGDPHYNHDLSFEAMHCFSVDATQQPIQLSANVENKENRNIFGVKYAHFATNNGIPNSTLLGNHYRNLVVWRPSNIAKKTNIEQWGALNYADFDLDTNMRSMNDALDAPAKFSYVQLTLFRGPLTTSNPFLIRSGVLADSAQVGVTHCKIGITKACDFNLDFKVDSADVMVWQSNLGRPDSVTIKTGDATNDQQVSFADFNFLTAFMPTSGVTPTISVTLNTTTGIVSATTSGVEYISLNTVSENFIPASASDLSGKALKFASTNKKLDYALKNNVQLNNTVLGSLTLPLSGALPDLKITVNYANSCNPLGFTFDLDSVPPVLNVQQITNDIDDYAFLRILKGQQASPLNAKITIFDLMGREVASSEVHKGEVFNLPNFNQNVYIARFATDSGVKSILVKR